MFIYSSLVRGAVPGVNPGVASIPDPCAAGAGWCDLPETSRVGVVENREAPRRLPEASHKVSLWWPFLHALKEGLGDGHGGPALDAKAMRVFANVHHSPQADRAVVTIQPEPVTT